MIRSVALVVLVCAAVMTLQGLKRSAKPEIVDLVAQDRATGAIVALIEVDDATHNAERDCARDEMTRGAGYRTVRIGRAVPARFQDVRAVVLPLLTLTPVRNQ